VGYQLNFDAVWRDFPLLMSGLGLGLVLASLSIVAGCGIGLVSAFAALSKRRVSRALAAGYVAVFRNTPILVLVLFTYFALPQIGVRLGKIESFVATLALYAGAYLTEVFRGALLAVPRGVGEAGLAIGLTEGQVRRSLVIPLMLRNALPALGSNFVSLFKDTSIAAAIAVPELTYYARKINVETFRVVETWMVASCLYVAACYLIASALRQVERWLAMPH
jgi:glutamine transport system permease protein